MFVKTYSWCELRTDNAGRYSVSVPKVEKLSLVSVCWNGARDHVHGSRHYNVVLREMVNEMDEVTVVSTG